MQFCGHHEEYKNASQAEEGYGVTVWYSMSQKTLQWNPEQNFGDERNSFQLQCRKNVKLIVEVLKEQLKLVNLVITTLLTSLHDKTMEGLNQGFKIATEKFEKIINPSEKILKKIYKILEIL